MPVLPRQSCWEDTRPPLTNQSQLIRNVKLWVPVCHSWIGPSTETPIHTHTNLNPGRCTSEECIKAWHAKREASHPVTSSGWAFALASCHTYPGKLSFLRSAHVRQLSRGATWWEAFIRTSAVWHTGKARLLAKVSSLGPPWTSLLEARLHRCAQLHLCRWNPFRHV